MIKKSLIALAVGTALISGSAFAKEQAPAADDSILVMFKPGVNKQQRETLIRRTGASLRQLDAQGRDLAFQHVADGRIVKVRVPKGVNKDFVMKQLARNPAVEVAEPNYLVQSTRAAVTPPNDPRFGDLWGLHNTGQAGGRAGADIKALDAWQTTTGDHSVIIGVIDSGMDYNHPDLIANRWVNPGNLPGHPYGYSSLNPNRDPMDTDSHGTHVAGTIGAAGDNGIGVVGVNWNVTLLPCSFLGPQGGSTAGAIECIDYYTNLKLNHGVDIKATNNSWGGGGFSETLRAAIQSGGDAGILFIAAAGNAGRDADVNPMYPAAYDLDVIVSVASTDRNDNLSVFTSGASNYGLTSVDLGAPGSAILSTIPNNGYAAYSGTSMASPHVAGAAALLWSVNPDITPLEMKAILMETGDSLPALEGKTVSGKRLNLARALEEADPAPGFRLALTPRNQNIVAGDTATFTLDINSVADWMQVVNLSLDASPALSGATLSANSAMPGDVVVLTVNTDTATAWGDYNLAITATDSSGELQRTVNASLNITPAFLQDYSYINDTPVAIPDNNAAGITSVISVPDDGTIFSASVDLNITHTWRGDLLVRLTSPTGTQHVLHNRTGGSARDLIGNYPISSFNGEQMSGDWVLFVSDNASLDTGTLNSWRLNLSALNDGPVDPIAPVAAFSYSISGLTASFTDLSTDEDSSIVAWDWSFGDGATSSQQNPSHTFAAAGDYTVSLTVTDDTGLTSTSSQQVSVADINFNLSLLRATRARTGSTIVDLRMNDIGAAVDVYRDGTLIDTVVGDRYRDRFTSTAPTSTYKLCLAGTQICSGDLVVNF
ncbi:S8 family serine peptidase [Alishewanella sp. HH-ZS]|uniref:S8 family serine peptidase n=1 Tax=Alishewanella sp. HH-ZS TaxID=1856684 RepID=UPI000823581F|nr:S8 family serine peptidase [Alishewanella sp. HH-ZS]OCW97300.1 peptidase S8 [Alishewanella sp. HH-ZS]